MASPLNGRIGRFLLYTLRESTSLYRRVAGVLDPPVGIPSLPCQRDPVDRFERQPCARRCAAQGDSQCGRPWARSQVVRACRGREGGGGGRRSRHRDAADRGLRRLCQRPVDRARARQPHRQGHRHHPAQGRARRPAEGRGRGERLRRLARRPRSQGRLPGAAEGARRLARQARQGGLHPAARRQSAEARHDRSARADPAQAAGRARPHRARAGGRRGARALRRAAGRRRQILPGDQGPHGRRHHRRQDHAVAQHHDRRAHRADHRQPRAAALAAGRSRQPLRLRQCRRLFDDVRRRRQGRCSRAW